MILKQPAFTEEQQAKQMYSLEIWIIELILKVESERPGYKFALKPIDIVV